ncbi:hypothetical protein CW304_28200 [Bacillus sp. UFRGS-B20]|nr:hypothetical protein CW304_28200 [Bacillus sp. UFRGS-B20]
MNAALLSAFFTLMYAEKSRMLDNFFMLLYCFYNKHQIYVHYQRLFVLLSIANFQLLFISFFH